MRRTRHVVLPVRSWQYIGLLIVSLMCLTLGLVSRDREGHSGSLAGPELTHRAPHEVDACPNLNPFTETPSCLITEKPAKPIDNLQTETSGSRISSRKSILSRSLSLDRLSRIGLQEIRERSSENRDRRTTVRLSRTRLFDESINRLRDDSRFRTIPQAHNTRKTSFDPATRLSRTRDLISRATDRRSAEQRSLSVERRLADRANSRFEDRRLQSTERREFNENARRQNSIDRRNSLNLQRRMNDQRDRRSSMERRMLSESNRQESREFLAGRREHRDLTRSRADRRIETRERRSLLVERRAIEGRDAERSSREDRKHLSERSARLARGDVDRNNNLDRRNRERSQENRRALLDRVANQERKYRFSVRIARDSRENLIRSTDRRSTERLNALGRETSIKRVRSLESGIERSDERRLSSERRFLSRSAERREINQAERRKAESRLVDRVASRVSPEDSRRERINRSQRIVSRRDSRGNTEFRATLESRHDFENIANREQRDRLVRYSRSANRNSMDRQGLARVRDSRDSSAERDLSAERRERTSRSQRSREERRVFQRSRETERRMSGRTLERVLERRNALDSARLDSRRIDVSSRSREESRMQDRRLERSPELRVSREKILEKRSARDSRSREERTLQKSREPERMSEKILERRLLERRIALDSTRLDSRRIDISSRSREESRMQNRRLERSPELRVSRERILEKRSARDSRSREERRVLQKSRKPERRISEKILERRLLERRIALDSARLDSRRIDVSSRSREESRMQDRRLERSPELRVSRERILEKRSARDSRSREERRVLQQSREPERRISERTLEKRVLERRVALDLARLESRKSSERRIEISSRSREESRTQDRRLERDSELRQSLRMMQHRMNSKAAAFENRVLRSSERRPDARRNLQIRSRVARSVENRLAEIPEKESVRHLRQRSINQDPSRFASLRRIVRTSAPEENREQRRRSTERMSFRIADNDRLSAKRERNLQDARVHRNVEIKAKIVPELMMNYELLKYPGSYDFMKQAFILALCTVYGLSLYKGKKSFMSSNIMQQMQRFIVW